MFLKKERESLSKAVKYYEHKEIAGSDKERILGIENDKLKKELKENLQKKQKNSLENIVMKLKMIC